MRKVYVRIVATLIMTMDEGVQVSDVISEGTTLEFEPQSTGVTVEDFAVVNTEVVDSK